MTDTNQVRRYADAIMTLIKEDQTPGRFPATSVPGTNSMTAWTPKTITGRPSCQPEPLRRSTCVLLSTMRSAGALPHHTVARGA